MTSAVFGQFSFLSVMGFFLAVFSAFILLVTMYSRALKDNDHRPFIVLLGFSFIIFAMMQVFDFLALELATTIFAMVFLTVLIYTLAGELNVLKSIR